jgi:uncharacterized membrane protein
MKSKIINGGLAMTMIVLSVFIALFSFRYLSFQPIDLITVKPPEVRASIVWLAAFYIHVGFGALALLIGGFQFIGKLRDKFTSLHRNVGKAYVISVFASAASGLGIAVFAEGGIVGKSGFAALAVLWLYSNYRAYSAIRRFDIAEHRVWMTRNYALTFAAVTLRLWLPLFIEGFGMAFNTAYPIIAWLCWTPNVLVAEYLVRRVRRPASVQAQAAAA